MESTTTFHLGFVTPLSDSWQQPSRNNLPAHGTLTTWTKRSKLLKLRLKEKKILQPTSQDRPLWPSISPRRSHPASTEPAAAPAEALLRAKLQARHPQSPWVNQSIWRCPRIDFCLLSFDFIFWAFCDCCSTGWKRAQAKKEWLV